MLQRVLLLILISNTLANNGTYDNTTIGNGTANTTTNTTTNSTTNTTTNSTNGTDSHAPTTGPSPSPAGAVPGQPAPTPSSSAGIRGAPSPAVTNGTTVCILSYCRAVTAEEHNIGMQIFSVTLVVMVAGILCFGTYHVYFKSRLYKNVANDIWWDDQEDAEFLGNVQMSDRKPTTDDL